MDSHEEDTMKSDSEGSSTHTSPDPYIRHEPHSHSVFELKPRRGLTMMNIISPLDFPSKRPFKNSVQKDDSQIKKLKSEEDKKPSGDGEDDNDEISILKAILDYYTKNGRYPFGNSSSLHEFLQNSLQIDVYPLQLRDKIVKLREEYKKIQWKQSYYLNESDNADDLNEFNEGENKGLRIGEKIDLSVHHFLKESLQYYGEKMNALEPVLSESIVKEALSLIGDSMVKELEEKWRKLKVEELELFLKKVNLIGEQTKLILDATKSSSLH